ncbi:MAG: 16S rRNA (uracil(1498)-N(3))-methyltransferase [Actinomycetota bacterium]|nr:16S rRNA (uracil(1498)-N(3))-methyltransferase [Actinomycetota bacterium]MDQ6933999.1 16S rRNA (uracil(1498)-N(3))-methyltransferase [Actinomycetota bacterium]
MTLPFFLAPGPFVVGSSVTLSGDEARHGVVRRIRAGEPVVLTDGAGTTARCTVGTSRRDRLVAVVETVRTEPAPTPQVSVVQAIPKGNRAELAVQMLTEVGVDTIVPWPAARCVAEWPGDRAERSLARWRVTAREAAKQSRRCWLPQVTLPATTSDVAQLLTAADLGVVLHEQASHPLDELPVSGAGSVVVVVGPEGGITEEELAAFVDAHVVRLGPTVLRTSTAGVAAVAALLSRTGRWA